MRSAFAPPPSDAIIGDADTRPRPPAPAAASAPGTSEHRAHALHADRTPRCPVRTAKLPERAHPDERAEKTDASLSRARFSRDGHRRPPPGPTAAHAAPAAPLRRAAASRSSAAVCEDAFRAIHDRYHERLLAYVRHMLRGVLGGRGRRAGRLHARVRRPAIGRARDRAVRAVALPRRPQPLVQRLHQRAPAPPLRSPTSWVPGGGDTDPVVVAERREELRRLVADLHNLPEQQRSVLIIRELEGLSYEELGARTRRHRAGREVAARAPPQRARRRRPARATDCARIREELALAVDRPGRPPRLLRDHLRVCESCRAHRRALRHGHVQLASVLPGPSSLLFGGWLATLLGTGGGGASSAATGRPWSPPRRSPSPPPPRWRSAAPCGRGHTRAQPPAPKVPTTGRRRSPRRPADPDTRSVRPRPLPRAQPPAAVPMPASATPVPVAEPRSPPRTRTSRRRPPPRPPRKRPTATPTPRRLRRADRRRRRPSRRPPRPPRSRSARSRTPKLRAP